MQERPDPRVGQQKIKFTYKIKHKVHCPRVSKSNIGRNNQSREPSLLRIKRQLILHLKSKRLQNNHQTTNNQALLDLLFSTSKKARKMKMLFPHQQIHPTFKGVKIRSLRSKREQMVPKRRMDPRKEGKLAMDSNHNILERPYQMECHYQHQHQVPSQKLKSSWISHRLNSLPSRLSQSKSNS